MPPVPRPQGGFLQSRYSTGTLNPASPPTGEFTMLLHSKKVGALLRCFTPEGKGPEVLEKNVSNALASVRKMQSMTVAGIRFISRVEILVPTDAAFAEKDCGQTAERLREALKNEGIENVYVSEVSYGDIFVTILNYGVGRLLRAGCDYGLIFSKEAEEYFTTESAEDLVKAAEDGALVAGIALNELTESIMQGRIANTFAMWHLMSLVQVGIFDYRNAKPKKDAAIVHRAQAWDIEKNFWHYDLAGVEEIIPMIRLVRTFGPCLAPILPRGDGVKVWKAPDPKVDLEGYQRHLNKLQTKFVRQNYFATVEDADLSVLTGGVMSHYHDSDYIK